MNHLVNQLRVHVSPFQGWDGFVGPVSQGVALGYRVAAPLARKSMVVRAARKSVPQKGKTHPFRCAAPGCCLTAPLACKSMFVPAARASMPGPSVFKPVPQRGKTHQPRATPWELGQQTIHQP